MLARPNLLDVVVRPLHCGADDAHHFVVQDLLLRLVQSRERGLQPLQQQIRRVALQIVLLSIEHEHHLEHVSQSALVVECHIVMKSDLRTAHIVHQSVRGRHSLVEEAVEVLVSRVGHALKGAPPARPVYLDLCAVDESHDVVQRGPLLLYGLHVPLCTRVSHAGLERYRQMTVLVDQWLDHL